LANEKNTTEWLLKAVKKDLKSEKIILKELMLTFLNTLSYRGKFDFWLVSV